MDLRTPNDGNGKDGATSRYLTCPVTQRAEGVSGLGAGNFQHTFTNPLIVFTGGQPVTGSVDETASAFSGNIALDGMVSAEEWGAPSSSPVQTIARIHGADSGSSALITAARCRRRSSM